GPAPKDTSLPDGNNLRLIGKAMMDASRKMAATLPARPSRRIKSYEFAFDHSRLAEKSLEGAPGAEPDSASVRVWDGKEGLQYSHIRGGSQEYGRFSDIKQVAMFFYMTNLWGRNGQRYWWTDVKRPSDDLIGPAEDYRLTGQENFHGANCVVLESP